MEALRDMQDNQYDLAIVDPPYGLNIAHSGSIGRDSFKAKEWDSKRPSQEYFNEIQRVAKDQIIWGWNYFADLLPPCKGFIYWNKLNHHDNRSDGELAYYSGKGLARHFEYMWDGNRYGFKGNIDGVGKKTIRIHPTQKPVKLYEWLLMNYANEGDKILDTHLGSGSIAIACHNLGFSLDAWELDKDYYQAAVKRFNNHKAQQRLF